jgi:hypothetical protein
MRALLFLFCFSFQMACAQHDSTMKHTTSLETYKKRRTTYNTIGWATLGTGIVLAGYSIYNHVYINGSNGHWDLESLFYVGEGLAIASVPFFILAGINKRKARLVLKGERLTSSIMFQRPYYPAISLQLHW